MKLSIPEIEIMAAHKIPYTATANIAFPEDFIAKLKKAREIKGPKFIQVISPCPVGWKFSSNLTIKIAKLAFETCVFPLYEVENGAYKIKNLLRKNLLRNTCLSRADSNTLPKTRYTESSRR